MPPMNIHPPDPNSPKGMAWICGAGIADPRVGKSLKDRQPMAIIQAWEATSEMWWHLGLRYHPDLATTWLVGGGQWSVGEIVDTPPAPQPEITMDWAAEKILEMVEESNPEFAKTIRNIKASGTPEQRAEALKRLEAEMSGLQTIKDYVEDK